MTDRARRILVISNGVPPHQIGGTEIASFGLACRLRDRGWQVRVVAIVPNRTSDVTVSREQGIDVMWLGYPLVGLNAGTGFEFGINAERWMTRLDRFMGDWEPDIVHVHFSGGVHALLGLLVARRDDLPLVLTWHSIHDGTNRGGELTLPICRAADANTTVSSSAAGRIEQGLRLPDGTMQVVWNGIEVESPADTAPSSSCTVLGIGSFMGCKRWPDLIRAFASIADELPGAMLRIIGAGPELRNCRQLVSDLKMRERVALPGAVHPDQVRAETDRCAVVVLPSSPEALGLALLEGAIAGRPVIGTYGEGAEDIIEDGVNGFLFAPGDVESLAARLRQLMENPELRDSMGRSAREHCGRRFGWAAIVPQWESMFSALMSSRSSAKVCDADARADILARLDQELCGPPVGAYGSIAVGAAVRRAWEQPSADNLLGAAEALRQQSPAGALGGTLSALSMRLVWEDRPPPRRLRAFVEALLDAYAGPSRHTVLESAAALRDVAMGLRTAGDVHPAEAFMREAVAAQPTVAGLVRLARWIVGRCLTR